MGHEDIKLPDGDVLIHAGDATFMGEVREVMTFCGWLKKQPHKYKIFVPGNHDFLFEESPKIAREMIESVGGVCLIDNMAQIEGVTFYGSPWTRRFGNWAFMESEERLKIRFEFVPFCDVLITHGPPYGILDNGHGDRSLLGAVLSIRPKAHIFGHIHEGHGRGRSNGVEFANVSSMNESYELINKPEVINI